MSVTSHSSEVSKNPSAGVRPNRHLSVLFFLALLAGMIYVGISIYGDVSGHTISPMRWTVVATLAVALLIALGFEFVNGFHDTANAVATVIYTNSLSPTVAVIMSGLCNFLGVLLSSGAVAFGVVALLPIDLVLHGSPSTGFAMVFALLLSAIAWNLLTWWKGIPASSSHTLIGSMIGVGVANAMINHGSLNGVNWGQAVKIGYSLLFSPLIGFAFAGIMLLALRLMVRNKTLYEAPRDNVPPPMWIRGLLVASSGGVAFAHGSNDGQKGMGLIMMILVSLIPATYALDRYSTQHDLPAFASSAYEVSHVLNGDTQPVLSQPADQILREYLRNHHETPEIVPALGVLTSRIHGQVASLQSFDSLSDDQVNDIRDDMYIASETVRKMSASATFKPQFEGRSGEALKGLKVHIDGSIKFIPLWVKVATALALGLGTVVGWKRVVHTVGEKIGKSRMTYAQGLSAQTVAMATIGAADVLGLPVSTTHVLSSGVAGTMAANRSGLQWATLRNLALTWVLTLPATILLAGGMFWLFLKF